MAQISKSDAELGLGVVGQPGQPVPAQCPLGLPLSARRAASSYADGGLGLGWPSWFWCTTNQVATGWILWIEDDERDFGDDVPKVVPIAWCKRVGISEHDACYRIPKAAWSAWKEESQPNCPSEIGGGEILVRDEVLVIVNSIWTGEGNSTVLR